MKSIKVISHLYNLQTEKIVAYCQKRALILCEKLCSWTTIISIIHRVCLHKVSNVLHISFFTNTSAGCVDHNGLTFCIAYYKGGCEGMKPSPKKGSWRQVGNNEIIDELD